MPPREEWGSVVAAFAKQGDAFAHCVAGERHGVVAFASSSTPNRAW
jgi:hypothetical protein